MYLLLSEVLWKLISNLNMIYLDLSNPIFLIYVLIFASAAVVCFWVSTQLDEVKGSDTRQGLYFLLISCGAWSASHVGFLLAPSRLLKVGFYEIGLLVGLIAVGAWLYFCSAYTNRVLHKKPQIKKLAIVVFVILAVVKLSNPVHHLYFSMEFASLPFPHLTVDNKILHLFTMGLAYGLSLVGYFMLLEKFDRVSYKSKSLIFLAGLTALPIIFDVIGYTSPYLIDITYEPIGVALFAVGVVLIYLNRFNEVKIAGSYKNPVIVLGPQNNIHEYNNRAKELFSNLENINSIGKSLGDIEPNLGEVLGKERKILEIELNNETRYYKVNQSPFAAGQEHLGKLIMFEDITEREKAKQREEFLHSLLRHDVQNKNQVIEGYLELLKEKKLPKEARKYIDKSLKATKESEDIIEKVRTLREIEEEEIKEIDINSLLKDVLRENRSRARDKGIKIKENDHDSNCRVKGGKLLKELFNNIIENSIKHSNANLIKVNYTENKEFCKISIEDNGKGIPEEKKDKIFQKGFKQGETGGTGLGLYLVKRIAKTYEGRVELAQSKNGGTKFNIYLKKV
ncbi:MAG: Signal transduction histidine kinase containing PAS domain [Candidatus Methanohalarchaeum thermophilum]|uniref:histidine kinase n=1 Tax=Methanohalarchaeum thermophilum TaxID=1903181 RepID=A0A1Q6DW93_METT1|nr:MAG: Signal transduction histidine kinase containing PAS domain [Candidatus Methanohalarchaeum thermophilum]